MSNRLLFPLVAFICSCAHPGPPVRGDEFFNRQVRVSVARYLLSRDVVGNRAVCVATIDEDHAPAGFQLDDYADPSSDLLASLAEGGLAVFPQSKCPKGDSISLVLGRPFEGPGDYSVAPGQVVYASLVLGPLAGSGMQCEVRRDDTGWHVVKCERKWVSWRVESGRPHVAGHSSCFGAGRQRAQGLT